MSKTARRKARKARPEPEIRRKNLNIDQAKLDRVKTLLRADSETEAIDQALAMLLLREDLVRGVEKIAGSGGVSNAFAGDREP